MKAIRKLMWRLQFTRWSIAFLDVPVAYAWPLSSAVVNEYLADGVEPREAANIEAQHWGE